MSSSIIQVKNLEKKYGNSFHALKNIDLEIKSGEIFALLGPNGAGKTTLISIICGITNLSSGEVLIDGMDNLKEARLARSKVGLVPQELTTDAFETVWDTVSFSRGLFGLPRNDQCIENVLKDLSLWDKKDNQIMMLSGGMKRRVMIAKALSHEPKVLFLDEPTAGVDVELRKSMWEVVRRLRESGVTIILTTHYLEEAEEMADRIGVINHGQLVLVEEKKQLFQKLGKKQLMIYLAEKVSELPQNLSSFDLELDDQGQVLKYTYDPKATSNQVSKLLQSCAEAHLKIFDIQTKQSSLEEIFVQLVGETK